MFECTLPEKCNKRLKWIEEVRGTPKVSISGLPSNLLIQSKSKHIFEYERNCRKRRQYSIVSINKNK